MVVCGTYKREVVRLKRRGTLKQISETSVGDINVSFNNPSMNLIPVACLRPAKEVRPSIIATGS